LIEDVTGFTETLEREFPASKKRIIEAVEHEVTEVKDMEGLKLLGTFIGDNDEPLSNAIQGLLAIKGNIWKNFDIAGEESSSVHVGIVFASGVVRQSGGNSFEQFRIGGAGHSHIGNSYSV
jgi:hypothetical protein